MKLTRAAGLIRSDTGGGEEEGFSRPWIGAPRLENRPLRKTQASPSRSAKPSRWSGPCAPASLSKTRTESRRSYLGGRGVCWRRWEEGEALEDAQILLASAEETRRDVRGAEKGRFARQKPARDPEPDPEPLSPPGSAELNPRNFAPPGPRRKKGEGVLGRGKRTRSQRAASKQSRWQAKGFPTRRPARPLAAATANLRPPLRLQPASRRRPRPPSLPLSPAPPRLRIGPPRGVGGRGAWISGEEEEPRPPCPGGREVRTPSEGIDSLVHTWHRSPVRPSAVL